MKKLECANMSHSEKETCENKVNRIDEKGFVYCESCGVLRKNSGVRCRRMSSKEIKQLESGKPLAKY